MAATYSVVITTSVAGVEILDAADALSSIGTKGRTLKTGGYALTQTFDADTQPSVDAPAVVGEITISGTTTVDFTAAPHLVDRSSDLTGMKCIGGILYPPATNTGAVTVAPGAANPYPLFGTGNSIELQPGQAVAWQTEQGISPNLPRVTSTVKNIDVTGTSDDVLKYELHFGVTTTTTTTTTSTTSTSTTSTTTTSTTTTSTTSTSTTSTTSTSTTTSTP